MKYLFYSRYVYVSDKPAEQVASRIEPYAEPTIRRFLASRRRPESPKPRRFHYVWDKALGRSFVRTNEPRIGTLAVIRIEPLPSTEGSVIRVSIRHGFLGQIMVYGFVPLMLFMPLYLLLTKPGHMVPALLFVFVMSLFAYLGLVYMYAKHRRFYRRWFERLFGENWDDDLIDDL